jgi:DNA polymerase (family X)
MPETRTRPIAREPREASLVTNAEVGKALSNIATMLEMDGGNPFRVRAYREAARVIQITGEPVAALAQEEGKLETLAGIGKDLAGKIRDLVKTGTTKIYDELKAKIPLEVVALTELQGLGPKRVGTLYQVLGVKNRAELEKAAKEGRLRDLPGFGEKVEQNVLRAIAGSSQWSGRMLLASAWPVAHALADHLREVRGVKQVDLAGSFRRRKETVGDLDVLACGGQAETVMKAFVTHPSVAEVLGQGETKSSVRLLNGLQVDLRLVPEASFGAAMLYFTGSKEHNIELRKIAIDNGMSLNEYGLTRGDRFVAGRTEEEVYRALGAQWVPPELREARGEIELARYGRLPRLIELEDVRGDLHMHTDRTDGRDSLEAMVRAARERGYEYVAITDHSRAPAMGKGFDEARVRRSVEEIAAVRMQVPGIEVLHGLEVDILADGALDLGSEGLDLLDWVIVAVHSRLDQAEETATERVLAALDHPAVCAMAHPRDRSIGVREGLPFDLERVFEHAAERGIAMEINAQPERTDLSDVNARMAHEKGVKLLIDTDAHSTVQLGYMPFGVFAARRAGLSRDDVLNTLPWLPFGEALKTAGERRRSAPRRTRKAPAAAAADAGAKKPAVAAPTEKRAHGEGPSRRPTAGPATRKPASAPGARKPAADGAQRKPAPAGPAKAPRRPR